MSFKRQVTIRMPPKPVFQFLCDPTIVEEFTKWRVQEGEGAFGPGFSWQESRLLARRNWTVTAYDRRGLTFTAKGNGVEVSFAAKKGGTGSCNLQMRVDGDAKAVARFEKTDGDRLEQFRALMEG